MSDGSMLCESIRCTTWVVARSSPSSSPLTEADAIDERPLKRGTPLTQRAPPRRGRPARAAGRASGSARGWISASSAGRRSMCRTPGTWMASTSEKSGSGRSIGSCGSEATRRRRAWPGRSRAGPAPGRRRARRARSSRSAPWRQTSTGSCGTSAPPPAGLLAVAGAAVGHRRLDRRAVEDLRAQRARLAHPPVRRTRRRAPRPAPDHDGERPEQRAAWRCIWGLPAVGVASPGAVFVLLAERPCAGSQRGRDPRRSPARPAAVNRSTRHPFVARSTSRSRSHSNRARRAVVGVAVDLDDQPPVAPDEVDLDALDRVLTSGRGMPWSSQSRRKRSSSSLRVGAGA